MHDTEAAKAETSPLLSGASNYLEFGHLLITQLRLTTALVSQRLYLSIKGVYVR